MLDENRINEIFGKNIRKYRKMRGLTQVQLGDMLGIAHGKLSKHEKNQLSINIELAYKVSKALKVRINKFLKED